MGKPLAQAALFCCLAGFAIASAYYEAFRVPAAVLDPETISQTQCACGPNNLGSATVVPSGVDRATAGLLGDLCAQWCTDQLGVCLETYDDLQVAADALEGAVEL